MLPISKMTMEIMIMSPIMEIVIQTMEKLVAYLPAESQKLGLEDKSNGTEYRSRCAAVIEAGAKEEEWKGKRTKEEEKAEKFETGLGELQKRRHFCLQGLICPVMKCSMPPGLRYSHLSTTSASSSFSVQCKQLNSTEGHKCPRFSGVRGLNVFSIPWGRKCP
ncbi:hypothetical protein AHAS_Ahas12G0091600 [Arachis hypogaea]